MATSTWIPPSQQIGVDVDESHAEKIANLFGGAQQVSQPITRRNTSDIEKEYPGFSNETAVDSSTTNNKDTEESTTNNTKTVVVGAEAGMQKDSALREIEVLSVAGRKKSIIDLLDSTSIVAKAPVRRRSLVGINSTVEQGKQPVLSVAHGADKNTPNAINAAINASREQKRQTSINEVLKAKEAEDAKLTPKQKALFTLSSGGKTRSSTVSGGRSGMGTSLLSRTSNTAPIEPTRYEQPSKMRERAATDAVSPPKKSKENACLVCTRPVYEMEKIVADNKLFHKWCFRCTECNKKCSTSTYAALNAQIYCKPCFKKLFKLKGNYDGGFGTEQHKTKWDSLKE